MPEYDVTQPSIGDFPYTEIRQITHLDAITLLVHAGKLATAAHYLQRMEASGRNAARLLAIAARELGLRERDVRR